MKQSKQKNDLTEARFQIQTVLLSTQLETKSMNICCEKGGPTLRTLSGELRSSIGFNGCRETG